MITITPNATTVSLFAEDDLLQHIEDTRLYSLFRNGSYIKRTWNELTATEKQQQLEAQRREAYIAINDVYSY